MKKSVATYALGLVVGSVLGCASLAAASGVYYVIPIQLNRLLGYGNCTTSGGYAIWGDDYLLNQGPEDLWANIRNVAGSASLAPSEVGQIDVSVYDYNPDSPSRVAAYALCSTASGTHKTMTRYTPKASPSKQNISFTNPWPSTCTTSTVMVRLPPYQDSWYEPTLNGISVHPK